MLNLKKRWALFYSTSWNLLNSLNSNTALRLLQILNDFEPNVTGFYKVPVCNISNNVVYLFIFLQVWHEGKQINVTSIVVTELPLIQRRWFTMKSKYWKRYAFLLHLIYLSLGSGENTEVWSMKKRTHEVLKNERNPRDYT